MKIALGSVLTECNQFGGSPIDLDWFARYELCRGDEILGLEAGVVGGPCRPCAAPAPTSLP